MDNFQEHEETQQSQKSLVHIIAVIFLAVFIISEVVTIILLALQILSWFDFLIVSIVGVIQLILLFALDNALRRIAVLENVLLEKGVIKQHELAVEPEFEQETDCMQVPVSEREGIKYCKECGYQLFPEDEECPNCNTKVND